MSVGGGYRGGNVRTDPCRLNKQCDSGPSCPCLTQRPISSCPCDPISQSGAMPALLHVFNANSHLIPTSVPVVVGFSFWSFIIFIYNNIFVFF